ncbi:hypothetical protein [Maridesulfovibrio sp.]|uniref:hypothetical protein n=1 Tax=Maridesulfovibrio sp. TaxID=2795000 RepID=UPI0029CA44BC|nr:hypothetical protein [Maridesulfovibrio sp.]
MTKTITRHHEFLRQEFGSYSGSARFLKVDPRVYRNQRSSGVMSTSSRRAIVLAAKYVQLRRTLKILRDEFGVSAADIRKACRMAKFHN